jgi:hypothetical protein
MLTTSTPTSKKRKPYTHLACTCCKEKHLKCDGARPSCQNCITKKIECHYREERNRRRESASSRAQQRIEDDLRDKLIFLEQEVERWKIKYYHLKELTQGRTFPRSEYDDIQSHQLQRQLHQLQLQNPPNEQDLLSRRRAHSTPVAQQQHGNIGEIPQYAPEHVNYHNNNYRYLDLQRQIPPGARLENSVEYNYPYGSPPSPQPIDEFDHLEENSYQKRQVYQIHNIPDRRKSFSFGDVPQGNSPLNGSQTNVPQYTHTPHYNPPTHNGGRRATIDVRSEQSTYLNMRGPVPMHASNIGSFDTRAYSFGKGGTLENPPVPPTPTPASAPTPASTPAPPPFLSESHRSNSVPTGIGTFPLVHSGSNPNVRIRRSWSQPKVPAVHIQSSNSVPSFDSRTISGNQGYDPRQFSVVDSKVDVGYDVSGYFPNQETKPGTRNEPRDTGNAAVSDSRSSDPIVPAISYVTHNTNSKDNGTQQQGYDPRIFSSLVDSKPADELYDMDMDEEDTPYPEPFLEHGYQLETNMGISNMAMGNGATHSVGSTASMGVYQLPTL